MLGSLFCSLTLMMQTSLALSRRSLPQWGRIAGSWNESHRHQAIQTEFSWTRTDQPHKKQYVKNFGKIKEIVHPIKSGKRFSVASKLSGQDGYQHIDQQHKTSQG